MAGLALVVSLVFISVLLIGPMVYVLSLFSWIPDLIIYIFAILSISIGIWWLILPLPLIRYYGVVDIWIGYKVISGRRKRISTA